MMQNKFRVKEDSKNSRTRLTYIMKMHTCIDLAVYV